MKKPFVKDLWGPLAYLCPVSCNCTNPNVCLGYIDLKLSSSFGSD